MKKIVRLALVFQLMSAFACHFAFAQSFGTVTQEQMSQIEELHKKAAGFITVDDFSSAIRVYMDILLVEPDDETAYTNLGSIYLIQGQIQKAHEAFANALHINPDNEVALWGIHKIMDPDGARSPSSPAPTTNTRIGKLYVQRLQMALKIAGSYTGPINGILDRQTHQSIRDFQKNRELPDTGSMTPETWNVLSLYLETPADRAVVS